MIQMMIYTSSNFWWIVIKLELEEDVLVVESYDDI